jgi:hypothetical protein
MVLKPTEATSCRPGTHPFRESAATEADGFELKKLKYIDFPAGPDLRPSHLMRVH